MLTDALGCEQCHHIFVVKPDGYTIEQCSAHHPPKSWYWTGRHWHPSRHKQQIVYWRFLRLSLVLGLIVIIFFPTVFPFFVSRELQIGMVLIMVFLLWSSLNRR